MKLPLQILESSFLFSPFGLLIRDGFTGELPVGRVSLLLERKVDEDQWLPVDRAPSISSTGVWSFPGLGQTVTFEESPQDFRITVKADFYSHSRPKHVKVYAYNDQRPLGENQYERLPRRIYLRPNRRYPFPTNHPVVRGRVVDSRNFAIENAEIRFKNNPYVRSDVDGFFSIPITWPPEGTWPPAEILLERDVQKGSLRVQPSSVVGILPNDQLTFEDTVKVVVEEDAEGEQADIAVSNIDLISESKLIRIQDRSLAPDDRHFAIDSIDVESSTLTLKSNLRHAVRKGTQVVLYSRMYTVRDVNAFSSVVTLRQPLTESWSRTARLVRFPQDLKLDIFHDGHSKQTTVPVPDGFRFLEFQW